MAECLGRRKDVETDVGKDGESCRERGVDMIQDLLNAANVIEHSIGELSFGEHSVGALLEAHSFLELEECKAAVNHDHWVEHYSSISPPTGSVVYHDHDYFSNESIPLFPSIPHLQDYFQGHDSTTENIDGNSVLEEPVLWYYSLNFSYVLSYTISTGVAGGEGTIHPPFIFQQE